MRRYRFFWIPIIISIIIPLVALGVMGLWNWLMPSLFGLGEISFLQSLGLLVLLRILIGPRWFGRPFYRRYAWHGHHDYYGHHRGYWRYRMYEKWQSLSPEEKAKNGRWNCGFYDETQRKGSPADADEKEGEKA